MVQTALCPPTVLVMCSVVNYDAHAAGGAGHHAHGGFDGGGVQVGHFQLGDLFDLGLGDVRNLVFIRTAGSVLDADPARNGFAGDP